MYLELRPAVEPQRLVEAAAGRLVTQGSIYVFHKLCLLTIPYLWVSIKDAVLLSFDHGSWSLILTAFDMSLRCQSNNIATTMER